LAPEANPGPLPGDACRLETAASDASASALPDATLDGPQEHSDAGAGKLADRAPDVPGQVGRALLIELGARREGGLCKPDAAPSAA